ncbi:MAG TPA: GDSL-type esterase/lipase family protein [Stellaceae bacterium]|nr:GDSL-type esterase/lipase family protein [Stellaceae bacterium]
MTLGAAALGTVLLLQACFTSSPPAPSPPPVEKRLSSPGALAPFFTALAALEQRQAQHPVRIIQIGDSHTANDSLSGRFRDLLQRRFGAAGRGWLPAGIPYKYYRPQLVSVSESGWRHFKPSDHEPGLAFGFDAVDAESDPRDAVMAIESTDPAGFDRFAVEYLTQPKGSAFTVQVDDAAPIRVSTAAAQSAIARFELPLDHAARQVELRASGKPPVVLLGWAVERDEPGVIYENHGTIGATVDLLAQMTPEAVAYELSVRQPALLVVAFGTNEGFADNLDLDRYAGRFRNEVASLHRQAPGVPILILGPPNANRVAKDCAPARCGSSGGDCTWQEPPKLAGVRDIERRVAADQGWAYWDWFAAMGGSCSIDRMASADPALAMPDHVHLSRAGYDGIAAMLFRDLMNAYSDWKARGPAS